MTTPQTQKRAIAQYLKTDRGKKTLRRYRKSTKGKSAQIRSDEKRKDDPDRKKQLAEAKRRYLAKKKAATAEATPLHLEELEEEKRAKRRTYQREWMRRKREEMRIADK